MITDIEKQRLKSRLVELVERISKKDPDGEWICPICGSGSHKNRTSAFSIESEVFHCFACDTGGDIFSLVAAIEKLDAKADFPAVVVKTYELLGEPIPGNYGVDNSGNLSIPKEPEMTEPREDYSEYFTKCHQNLKKSEEAKQYLYGRGLTDDTINRLRLGYDPNHFFPQLKKEAPAIIFPYNNDNTYFAARSIEDKAFHKPGKDVAGSEPLYNRDSLYNVDNRPVFVVEGLLDAPSIEQLGFNAVSVVGTSHNPLVRQLQTRTTKSTLIIAFDNDSAGKKRSAKLREKLVEMGIQCFEENLTEELGLKDANEALVKDPEIFLERLRKAEVLNSLKVKASDNDLLYILGNKFYQDQEDFRRNRNIKTGFPVLDQRLGGGIYPGLYVLGAATSLGKTTFCHQIACHMAHTGVHVLFFNLEMSKFEMVSRGISREIGRLSGNPKESPSSFKIRKNDLTDEMKLGVKRYAEYTGGKLNDIECEFGYTVEKIIEYTENFIVKNSRESTSRASTVVFIDYLQILSVDPSDRNKSMRREEIDDIVKKLKKFSISHRVPIFVVSSLNRGNYILPVSFESFKESGGIEYTADVVIGLQLKCLSDDSTFTNGDEGKKINEKRKKIREAMAVSPREIELLILKNRFGVSTGSICYAYYCNCDWFTNEDYEKVN